MSQQFFYDNQFRRIFLQIIRMFGEFTVQYDGPGGALVKVPCMYGDPSMQVASILTQNTENVMQSVPRMAIYVSNLKISRERTQEPTFIRKQSVRTRVFDQESQTYLPQPGNAYTVQKLMPIPLTLDIKLDIWTSNTNQKLQLIEQILPLFNPAMEIQFTDQYLDWTSLTTIELTDINWTSRSVPQGTSASDAPIDVCTLTFTIPIWISLAANVSKLSVIFKVITNMFDESGAVNSVTDFIDADNLLLGTREVVTFHNYGIFVENGGIQLLHRHQLPTANGALSLGEIVTSTVPWPSVLDKYGNVIPGVSEIRLCFDNENSNLGNIIVGTIAVDPSNANILIYNVDSATLPVNSLAPIDNFINPQEQGPGINMPAPVNGVRYLLTDSIGANGSSYFATAWVGTGNIVANANDIIQYNGTNWIVSFNSQQTLQTEFVTNLANTEQYRWTGQMWTKSWEGFYPASRWSIVV